MAQITWRNVDAPNQSVALQGIKQFGDMFGSATKGFGDATATFDNDTRVAAASPAISAYFQAAATGDPRAAQAALTQNAQGFGNLTPDQLSKVFSTGGGLTSTSLGTQTKQFDFNKAMQGESDQLAVADVLNRAGKQIGNDTDIDAVLNSDPAFMRMSPAQQLGVRKGLQGQGWTPFGPGSVGGGAPISGQVGGKSSRADRNNNPGNLKGPAGTWVRNAPGYVGDDGGFAQFDTRENGMAAMANQLNRYREGTAATGGKKVTTVQDIIGTWSPVADPKNPPQSTVNYTKYVADKLGLNPGDEVPPEKMRLMANYMYEFESGNKSGGATSNSVKASTLLAEAAKDNALGNVAPVNKLTEAAKDTTTSVIELASRVSGSTKIPPLELNDAINKIVREQKVPASVAAAILENGGLRTDNPWFFGKDSWELDDKQVKAQAEMYKGQAGLVNVAVNEANAARSAAITSANDTKTAALANLNRIKSATVSNPALGGIALTNAQRQFDTALNRYNSLTAAPVEQVPVSVATTTGKVSGAAKVDEMIALKDEPAPLRSTDGGKTWRLDVPETIRDPSVPFYRQIPNPVSTALKGKSFASGKEAEAAYRKAISSSRS